MTAIFKDPRHCQLAVLSALLAYGVAVGAFEIAPLQIAAILVTALAVSLVGQGLNDALNPRLKGR